MDFYKILGVSVNSSPEEIKKAWRKKAHEYHPDKGGDESEMKLINNAYRELQKTGKSNASVKPFYRDTSGRLILKCKTCGKDTYHSLCLDCWIKIKKEEKRQRIHNIRSFMFCLNCDKSLYYRKLNTIFCNTNCAKEYYKKRGKTEIKKPCSHDFCLSKEEKYRLSKIDIEKICKLKQKERVGVFTRLIGKKKARGLDAKLQKEFNI